MNAKRLSIVALIAILAVGCGSAEQSGPTPDVNALFTAVAQTVIAEFTLTASAPTPTIEMTATEASTPAGPVLETPLATPTAPASPTIPIEVAPTQPLCDDSSFDSATVDVTIPDGTQMSPGQEFLKTWKIRNTGTCTWGQGYKLIFAYGDRMSGQALPLPGAILPGEEVEVSVQFKAPTQANTYLSAWRMANAINVPFGEEIFVKIVVR